MLITKELLKEKGACSEGFEWFAENYSDGVELAAMCDKLLAEKHFDWASWMLRKLFDKTQSVKSAVFAAEQVIKIFEKKYPDDLRPRRAIEAAKKYLNNPSDKNKKAAYAAAVAADAAAAAVAAAAAYAAADAADAAADAAYAAADAAYAAADAAAAAYYAAADAAYYAAAADAMKSKIIKYGVSLIELSK